MYFSIRKSLKKISGNFINNLMIRRKLIISYIGICVSGIVITAFICYIYASSTIKNEVINYSSISVAQINNNIDMYIDEMNRLSTMSFSDKELQSILKSYRNDLSNKEQYKNDEEIENFLFNLYVFKPNMHSITIYTNSGRLYTEGVNKYINPEYDITKESWYYELMNSPQKMLLIGPRNLGIQNITYEKQMVFSLVRKIPDMESNKDLGIIILDTSYDFFKKIIAENEIQGKGKILILDENNNVVYSTDEEITERKPVEGSISNVIQKGVKNSNIKINGKKNLITYSCSSNTGWKTVAIIPENQLLSTIANMKKVILLIVIVSIYLAAIVSIIISSSITKPIFRLREMMKRVEKGDMNVSFDVTAKDEIGELGVGFNHMIMKIDQLIHNIVEIKTKNKDSEIKVLQSQINPHFLYNTLESIRMKAVVNKDPDVASMIKVLAKLFRLSVDRRQEFIAVREEIEYIDTYIKLQNMRFNDKFNVKYDISEELMKVKILKLTLQPLIENAVYHGLETKLDEGTIYIQILRKYNNLYIRIEDDGIGIDDLRLSEIIEALNSKSETNDKMGIGIKNVHERLKLNFGEKYGLNIKSKLNEGTIIEFIAPIIDGEKGDRHLYD